MPEQRPPLIVLTDSKPLPKNEQCCRNPKRQPAGTFGDEYEICVNCGHEFRGNA